MAILQHPIFFEIYRGDLEAVKQRVLADPAVLEAVNWNSFLMMPLIYAKHEKPTIAHWLIDHRGQHDVNTRDADLLTALHCACDRGPLSLVQALVASGADPTVTDVGLITPLMYASMGHHSDTVAYLLRLPAVRATIDTVNQQSRTALSYASREGSASCVQLLDAGADPTIPAGDQSPLNLALSQGHTAVAVLLRHAIAEPNHARTLHKARALLDAGLAVRNAGSESGDEQQQQPRRRMHTRGQQKRAAIAAAPVYLKGRVQREETLPVPAFTRRGKARVRATVAFVLGLEEGGVAYAGLPGDVYLDLLGYLLPAWADKGPEGVGQEQV